MEDLHKIFTKFKNEFPKAHTDYEALGKEIHEKSGPLTEKTCWLLKIAISGASRHELALETEARASILAFQSYPFGSHNGTRINDLCFIDPHL